MKRIFLSTVIFSAIAVISAYAQINPPVQNTQVIKPVLVVEDCFLVYQSLNNIDIRGSEVESFLRVKKMMESAVTKAQAEGKTITDKIMVEMDVAVAQDMLVFLQRVSIKGADAGKFQRFIDAIVEAAKKLQSGK